MSAGDDRTHITAGPGAPPTWNPQQEEGLALAAREVFGPLFEHVKAQLPPGTECALAIEAPALRPGEEGRVLVFSTDRTRMAELLAGWILHSDALRR